MIRTGACVLIPVQWRSEFALNGRWNRNLLKSGWNHVYPLGLHAYRSISMIKLVYKFACERQNQNYEVTELLQPANECGQNEETLNRKPETQVTSCEDVCESRYRVVCMLVVWFSGFFNH